HTLFIRQVKILSSSLQGRLIARSVCHQFSCLKFVFNFSDLKLHLQSTDYGNFLANEASPLTVSVIDDKLKEKMVVEFRHMRNHAYEPLASFLDFITTARGRLVVFPSKMDQRPQLCVALIRACPIGRRP
uniref:Uncharacterized protein n=1 Tax=Laticauda laticaudata TaxID=8630 RepID=A0A8C5RBT2_LATLA